MEGWLERVIKEDEDLDIKLEKLIDFINSDKFDKLTEKNKLYLCNQCNAMISYSFWLKERIKINLSYKGDYQYYTYSSCYFCCDCYSLWYLLCYLCIN